MIHTEASIIKILANTTDIRKFPWQLCNSFVYKWECDYWTMTDAGITREFEIKISRADFFKDAHKEKHKADDGANYFYYVFPEGLIRPEEIDKRFGIIEIVSYGNAETPNYRPVIKRKPRQLNKNTFTDWKTLANKMYWKFYSIWKDKWIEKEITRKEYFEGFNLGICEFETEETTLIDGLKMK